MYLSGFRAISLFPLGNVCFENHPYCCFLFLVPILLPPLQVARAGRFGTKGLAITFVSEESDAATLNSVQDRFEVNVTELPDELDVTTYSK